MENLSVSTVLNADDWRALNRAVRLRVWSPTGKTSRILIRAPLFLLFVLLLGGMIWARTDREIFALAVGILGALVSFVAQSLITQRMSAPKPGGLFFGPTRYVFSDKGVEVERKARLVHIYNFRFTHYEEPYGFFRVACTKGTYVRSLAHELGQKLGCGAHLATLRRVTSGKFDVSDAIQYEEVLKLTNAELEKRIIPFLKLAS